MSRVLAVIHPLALIVLIFSATMLAPLAVSWYYADGAEAVYGESCAITFGTGLVTWLLTRRYQRELMPRDGFLLVTLVWTVLPVFATLPLMRYLPALSFTDAYFEAVSGITATGSTVLSDLDRLPHSINFWRCELVWLGGMGLIVLAVAILPLLGVGGMQIYKAETPGPMKDAKLTPRIAQTAKSLWFVYVGISAACLIALRLAGMAWFDAICHAFTTMGLGGFSIHDASVAEFDSIPVEIVTIVFMLVAGVNFATHFTAWREKGARPYRADPEAVWFILITLGAGVLIAVYLWQHAVYADFWTALRYAMFNTVSIATTTGFANTDYSRWPIFAPVLMLFLCCFASSSGSTGGGIKMVRAILLFRQGLREFTRLIHPRAEAPVKLGGVVVPDRIVYAVLAFMSIYGACVVVMTFLLMASGLDAVTAFTAIIATVNNTGPGLNEVGPATTYASLSDFQIWVCTVAMLAGRLELFTLFIIFTPAFWRK